MNSGYKTVQTAHALADFAVEHPEEFKAWQLGSNYLCCLESSLDWINDTIQRLNFYGVKFTVFREPDIGNEITAICVESLPKKEHKKYFKNLKLSS